jgi:hypothetical protein
MRRLIPCLPPNQETDECVDKRPAIEKEMEKEVLMEKA